jgi:L-aminopeptidase/D-esterase-like protein
VDGDGAVGGVTHGGARELANRPARPAEHGRSRERDVLSSGSAYVSDAAQGAVKYPRRRIGERGAAGVVPIVPAAILFDLGFGGGPKIRPTADCGYKVRTPPRTARARRNVGAGAGATVGKFGNRTHHEGGLGSAASRCRTGSSSGRSRP